MERKQSSISVKPKFLKLFLGVKEFVGSFKSAEAFIEHLLEKAGYLKKYTENEKKKKELGLK